MSEHIAFFAAPGETAAAAVRNRGPAGGYPTVDAEHLYCHADDAVIA